ncbi:MAG: hypothetical protein LBK94_03960 [Prevotellaceae bacterium]|jgi:hypothetical protein|nr:hypothetical protein [Prevotellaceae bacterium]
MKKTLELIAICFLLASCSKDETIVKPPEPPEDYSPYCNKVYEYKPAPGQFINGTAAGFENVTTATVAAEYAEKRLKESQYVSLGTFGGYLVVGFDHSIENKNGYDFSIKGNQFDNSSEPAVVWVMQDVNKNGLPDDVWYELKGSEYGKPETVSNYSVTYHKPQNPRENVLWTDSEGNSGYIEINEHNTQDYYYPLWIAENSYTLTGVRLEPKDYIDPSTGYYCTGNYDWGYADNYGSDMQPSEGTKNFFKISNAVKSDGSPANLPHIDFIKIQNALNRNGQNGTGELSTEVLSIKDENL